MGFFSPITVRGGTSQPGSQLHAEPSWVPCSIASPNPGLERTWEQVLQGKPRGGKQEKPKLTPWRRGKAVPSILGAAELTSLAWFHRHCAGCEGMCETNPSPTVTYIFAAANRSWEQHQPGLVAPTGRKAQPVAPQRAPSFAVRGEGTAGLGPCWPGCSPSLFPVRDAAGPWRSKQHRDFSSGRESNGQLSPPKTQRSLQTHPALPIAEPPSPACVAKMMLSRFLLAQRTSRFPHPHLCTNPALPVATAGLCLPSRVPA